MPSKKIKFENNEIYHIMIRSVGDTPIFIDENDYFRGIFSIYEFNNSKKISIYNKRRNRKRLKLKIRSGAGSDRAPILDGGDVISVDDREKFVEILAFAIMPNHVHLLVRQIKDDGISKFMQKFGGLAWYFNKKLNRKGHLFCSYKSVHIKTDEQLRNVFVYIHCNPISLIESEWKENGIKDVKKTIDFLDQYKWSSYKDYVGIKNFISVTQRDFLLDFFGNYNACKLAVEDWIKYKSKSANFDFNGTDLE